MDPREVVVERFWVADESQPQSEIEALLMSAPGEELSHLTPEHPLARAVGEVLLTFDEIDRDLLIMSLMGEMPIRDVAAALGMTKSTAHRRLRVLTVQLHKRLAGNCEVAHYLQIEEHDCVGTDGDDEDRAEPGEGGREGGS